MQPNLHPLLCTVVEYNDVQLMKTLEAALWKHLYLRFHVFDANTAACKNCGGYFSKENDPASDFLVV